MKRFQNGAMIRISTFCIICGLICGGFLAFANFVCGNPGAPTPSTVVSPQPPSETQELPTVYLTTDISPAGLAAMYQAVGRKLTGKVAVKLSTGEPGGHYYLSPNLIKDLVKSVNGTIVECNTAYGGKRISTELHKQVARDHGFTAIAPVDIMDEEGSISLPVPNGKNIKEDFVGSHLTKYDSMLVLSHFKGHEMGGFGGAIKNISIGIASASGKKWIHTAGVSKTDFFLAFRTPQDAFLESMAEAAGAVMKKLGNNIVYINVMNNLSIDCDCNSYPAPPELGDIGILASLDPVALDQASVDRIYLADPKASKSLRERIELKNGLHTLEHAVALGFGSRKYRLVVIK